LISVSNYLEIDGDVDYKTGNIIFDGFITINGTVSDGFSVESTKDIEIRSQLGLGNVKHIISKSGSIYIEGGIAGKGKTLIQAGNNVYAKYVENASIKSNASVHIGFYCINSCIEARDIIVDSDAGKIIGGNIKAEVRVISPIIGSNIEKRTIISITGFDRHEMEKELSNLAAALYELKIALNKPNPVSELSRQKSIDTAGARPCPSPTTSSSKHDIKALEEKIRYIFRPS
jgi:uncharacterized protein (DUF342 family)